MNRTASAASRKPDMCPTTSPAGPHRGMATRVFERRFQLADFVEVRSADFDNGLLRISLKREIPDAIKPRRPIIDSKARAPSRRQPEGGGRSLFAGQRVLVRTAATSAIRSTSR